jgi:tetratricopeptide (TPR) repeat protein
MVSPDWSTHLDTERILAFAVRLEGEPKDVFLHLLACARCRAKALSLVEDETNPELPLPDPFWARIGPLIASRREDIERDQAMAGLPYMELLSHPPEERARLVQTESRFRSPGLVRRLLAASQETKDASPDRAEALARLALEIAQALPLRVGEVTLSELRTRAWCEVGDLRRMRGDFRQASRAFRRAAHQLASESLDSLGRAVFCRHMARLRKDQGRLDEALSLYGRAAVLFDTLESFGELGETLVEEGWLRHRELDPESARSIFQAAASLLDAKKRPRFILSARQGLALCAADLGRPAEAEEILTESREAMASWAGPMDSLRNFWIEAQVAERSGDLGKAADILRRVLQGLIAEGELYDAALAALELASLYIELRSRDEVERLRGETGPLRALAESHRTAWETFSLALGYALRGDRSAGLFLENAAQYLSKIRHDSDLRFHPWLKPPTEMSWENLDPALRRQLLEQAGLPQDLGEKPAAEIDAADQDKISRSLTALTGQRLLFPTSSEGEPLD